MSDTIDDFKNIVCNKHPDKCQEIMGAFESVNINDEHKSFFEMFFIERLKCIIPLPSKTIWAWYLGKENKKKIDERDSIAEFIDLYNLNNEDSFKIIDWFRENPDCVCKNRKDLAWAIEHTMITLDKTTCGGSSASDIDQIIKSIQARINRKDKPATYRYDNKNKENVLLLEIQPVIDGSDLNKLKNSSFVFPSHVIRRCFVVVNLFCAGKAYGEIGVVEDVGK